MTTQKRNMAILAVVVCLACMGCQPTIQPSEETGTEKSDPELTECKENDDSFRMRLLMVGSVQKDLRLTDDQREKLSELFETHITQVHKIFPELSKFDSLPQTVSVSEAEHKEWMQKHENYKSVVKKFQAKSFTVLTPDQTERLKQIHLQATMPESLKRPEIVKALDLSEEQLDKIRTLCDQMHQRQLAQLSDRSNPDQDERMLELLKTSYKDQVETANSALDILTPEQRTELEKLTGKKIDLPQIHNVWIQRTESYFENPDGHKWSSPFTKSK